MGHDQGELLAIQKSEFKPFSPVVTGPIQAVFKESKHTISSIAVDLILFQKLAKSSDD